MYGMQLLLLFVSMLRVLIIFDFFRRVIILSGIKMDVGIKFSRRGNQLFGWMQDRPCSGEVEKDSLENFRKITTEMGEASAKNFSATYFEVSAKESSGIAELFNSLA
jgi:hypothetical protein